MSEIDLLKRRIARERASRIQAEQILEKKALELYESNRQLSLLNESLEEKIIARTEQLTKSEQKYRSILENMELGILEVDTNGIISNAYPRFCQLVGFSEEELKGKDPKDVFLLPEYIDVIEKNKAEKDVGKVSAYEIQIKKKDGTIIWVLVSGAPFYNETGKIAGSIGVHYDITEQKKMRANLQRAKMLAVQAQKAEQNFLSNMSHEIRTPLNAIVGMAHLLKETHLDTEQNEYLDILHNSSKVLLALISDILDLTKIDTGMIEVQSNPFNLVQLLHLLERTFLAKLSDKEIDLTFSIDSGIDKMLIGDELLINQILLNLIGNAGKFTEKGFIKIVVTILEKTTKSTLIRFSIEDSGIGISQEKIKIIFEDFKQASSDITRKFGGSGLGLAITKKLIKLLGGNINVESEIDKGTKFWFDLSFENSELNLNVEEQKQYQLVLKSDIDPLLIVEDNIMNQKYITKILAKWNIPYEVAQNGQEGIDMSKKKKYSLILMDIQMPLVSGYEASEFIRNKENKNIETPIIALTASALLSKKQKAMDFGMNDYLAKPFTPGQLSSMLNKYLPNVTLLAQNMQIKSESVDLDSSVLEETYGEDFEYAIEMFETFLEVTPKEIESIRRVIEDKEKDDLARLVHKIKPTFSMVGLSKMTTFMETLEQTINEKTWEEIATKFEEFEALLKGKLPLIEKQLNIYKSKIQ